MSADECLGKWWMAVVWLICVGGEVMVIEVDCGLGCG